MDFIPCVYQAVPGDCFTVYAYLNDGTVRLVDVTALVERGGIFARLRDPDFFREALTVMNHTVAWDVSGDRDPAACIDIDPLTIYEAAPVVRDPLEPAA